MKRYTSILLFVISLAILPTFSNAQCKGFVKKHLNKMAPFTHNGQMNVKQVTAGETTEIGVTFYSGQGYRLVLASDENLGQVYYNLIDEERNVIYSSKDSGKMFKDFNVANTMRLTIEIVTTKGADKEQPVGCVSVLVGFKSVAPTRGGF